MSSPRNQSTVHRIVLCTAAFVALVSVFSAVIGLLSWWLT